MSLLHDALVYLLDEAETQDDDHGHFGHYKQHLDHMETSSQLALLHELLCIRLPNPETPTRIRDALDTIVQMEKSHRLLTKATSISPTVQLNQDSSSNVRIGIWKGDITTLTDVTAITNAANSQMLGCFQPTHRCIDNVIHQWAGPGLREECAAIMQARDKMVLPGEAIVTGGHALPAAHVIHVVGPQLRRGARPTSEQKEQLRQCYQAILKAMEDLPTGADGRKSVALCGISTGLFAFPAQEAAEIAVGEVLAWCRRDGGTTITDIIFDVFTDDDLQIYRELLASPGPGYSLLSNSSAPAEMECESISLARDWLHAADAILVSAGAGLSAAIGLDYTSTSLFRERFPGFIKYGFKTLYSVFGYDRWPSEQDRWGYFFTHLNMVQTWPKSPLYSDLISFLHQSGADTHVRTSNADGLFIANGWSADKLSTPQGSYAVLQCVGKCRPDSVVHSAKLVAEAQEYLDPVSQRLADPNTVPTCRYCGGRMSICVRGGSWFNEAPFREGEGRWKQFMARVKKGGKRLVILELGVGMNTPGVLRWPNEDALTSDGEVRLIRVGLGATATVPMDMEEEGKATCIDGDIAAVLPHLLKR
ncbi:hypothetical protein B0I35DRAFT_440390 [Stachybotrys elegans]|uniref:ADP-ribose 1''-phosphate phosphatase n=1 Tax=Stachybotrys elegans TaxID=80388 RepID=A0A8K0SMI6_9HYPO|nr:hypothetical protein B0I35DRAFT_440390 [Stachybotrys elegans]